MSSALDNFGHAEEKAKADEQRERLTRMYAALSATNEAILRAKSPVEMFQLICQAVSDGAKSLGTAVFLHNQASGMLEFAAGAGKMDHLFSEVHLSADPASPLGQGLHGPAFRTGKICVSNDVENDPRMQPWRRLATVAGIHTCAALPLMRFGQPVGVFLFFIREVGWLDDQGLELMGQISENISFGLEVFEHENRRLLVEKQKDRFSRMFATLSATNEAIMRAKTREELFELVCDAAVLGGTLNSANILLSEPGSEFLHVAASRRLDIDRKRNPVFAVSAEHPAGRGLIGTSFRTREPCIANDYLADERTAHWHGLAREDGTRSGACFPLLENGEKSIGVLLFLSNETDVFSDELVGLLARLAENVSFALDNFDRAEEKARADEQKERLTGMFEALSATNEAIMRAKTREQLFVLVCEAAVLGGTFASVTIALAEPGGQFLRNLAWKGRNTEEMKHRRVAISADLPEGRGLNGTAFRTLKPCIINNFMADERTAYFRDIARAEGTQSGASFPLLKNGKEAVGTLLFFSREEGAFTHDLVTLLAKLAENVSFALDNFDRIDEKARTEEQKDRLTRMFASLSGTNEAIMRARSRSELFDLVCEAAVVGGRFTSTAITLERPDSEFLENVAAAGPDRERAMSVRLSVDAARPEGQGITGTAFRTRLPCISNDYLADFAGRGHFFTAVRDSGTRSGAALPLLKGDKAFGVLVFLSSELGVFSPEMMELLQRLAENVSFALDNFDRLDEKARAEEQKDRLARMFAALSATNEAIMRARSRSELFELVCEAAAGGGKFTSTSIGMVRPGKEFLDIVASAGPTAQQTRKVKLSVKENHPEGRGITGIAFRSRKACISNDYLADPRGTAFHGSVRSDGARAVAAFPLFSRDEPVGILLFVAAEVDAFTPGFVDLLQRLADNLSFALHNFDLAFEKTKADKQRDRLTRMFEALSATNEAIMRARSREELFELVCEAAVLAGTFTSATILLADPGEKFLRIAATKGRNNSRIRSTRFSISDEDPEGRGLSGMTFRTKVPTIINNFVTDERTAHWHVLAQGGGTLSGAGFPLLKRGSESVGVMLFFGSEEDLFTGDLVELACQTGREHLLRAR